MTFLKSGKLDRRGVRNERTSRYYKSFKFPAMNTAIEKINKFTSVSQVCPLLSRHEQWNKIIVLKTFLDEIMKVITVNVS